MKCIIWDVEHGSASFIVTPSGRTFAVDLGVGSYHDSDDSFSPLLHLKRNGVSQLDAVILTHPHRDHIDDIHNFDALAPKLLVTAAHLTEQEIRAENRSTDQPIIDKYLEILRRYNAPAPPSASHPFTAQNNGGVEVKCFVPSVCARTNLNNHSVVTVFSYAGFKLLIPGDNEPPSWDELLKKLDFIEAIKDTDVLVAPHHGRESGFSANLFKTINPRITIISDGRFCDTSATSRYSGNSRGWKIHKRGGGSESRNCLTTRSDGTITVEFGTNSDGRYLEITVD
ncbi:MAG TPA: MBL fold metallo-hydrolase [Bryobacteraceae bacterium]